MFAIQSLLTIVAGVVLIKWSEEIANWLGRYVGTNLFRDIDNPFVIKIVGFFLIASTLFFWLV